MNIFSFLIKDIVINFSFLIRINTLIDSSLNNDNV